MWGKWLTGIVAAGIAGPALAGEGLFSRVYTTDLTPAGTFEFEELVLRPL